MKELGPYAVEAKLGAGGMGVVYRARDTRDGRVVALKVLRDALGDPELLERFRLEAKVLRGLEHPNLVRVFDYDLSPPRPYVVFEFVPGETLEARVAREGPLPIPDALRILSEVAAGLAAAHDRDLLHRDVKPANVLLGPGGAKLADFGLVKRLDSKTLTQSGATLGTASYMAPEQVGSDKARWGPSTDVYGLAATLHYALTGAPPFAGPNTLVTLSRVLDEPPPRPSALRSEVPEWLDAVCTRGMAKPNRDRFPSAVAFRLALREGEASRSLAKPLLAGVVGAVLLGLGAARLFPAAAPAAPDAALSVALDSPGTPAAVASEPPDVESPLAELSTTPSRDELLADLRRLEPSSVAELNERTPAFLAALAAAVERGRETQDAELARESARIFANVILLLLEHEVRPGRSTPGWARWHEVATRHASQWRDEQVCRYLVILTLVPPADRTYLDRWIARGEEALPAQSDASFPANLLTLERLRVIHALNGEPEARTVTDPTVRARVRESLGRLLVGSESWELTPAQRVNAAHLAREIRAWSLVEALLEPIGYGTNAPPSSRRRSYALLQSAFSAREEEPRWVEVLETHALPAGGTDAQLAYATALSYAGRPGDAQALLDELKAAKLTLPQQRHFEVAQQTVHAHAKREARASYLEASPDQLQDRKAVAAYLGRATRMLEAGRRRPADVRQRLLTEVWKGVLEAAVKVDRDRYAEVGGEEVHAWFTARLDDPDFPPHWQRKWDYVLFLDEARATYVDRGRSARWATVGEELLERDRAEGKVSTFRALINVACLHVYKEPPDPERAKALVARLEQRDDLTPGQQTALRRVAAQISWVESKEAPR